MAQKTYWVVVEREGRLLVMAKKADSAKEAREALGGKYASSNKDSAYTKRDEYKEKAEAPEAKTVTGTPSNVDQFGRTSGGQYARYVVVKEGDDYVIKTVMTPDNSKAEKDRIQKSLNGVYASNAYDTANSARTELLAKDAGMTTGEYQAKLKEESEFKQKAIEERERREAEERARQEAEAKQREEDAFKQKAIQERERREATPSEPTGVDEFKQKAIDERERREGGTSLEEFKAKIEAERAKRAEEEAAKQARVQERSAAAQSQIEAFKEKLRQAKQDGQATPDEISERAAETGEGLSDRLKGIFEQRKAEQAEAAQAAEAKRAEQQKAYESKIEGFLSGAEEIPTQEPETVEESEAMKKIEEAAARERESMDNLLNYLKEEPAESSVERYKRLQKEAGREELIKSREDTFKQVQRVGTLLDELEGDIQERGEDVGITGAQARRIEAAEREPLTEQLKELNRSLELQNLQLSDVDDEISMLSQLGAKDEADRLDKLKQIASMPGLTSSEKEMVSQQLAKETEEATLKRQERQAKKEALDKGLEEMRNTALELGIITDKFSDVVESAYNLFEAGEDPQVILSRVSAAVSSNPKFQDAIKLGIAKTNAEIQQKLASASKYRADAIASQAMDDSGFDDKGFSAQDLIEIKDDFIKDARSGKSREQLEKELQGEGINPFSSEIKQLLDDVYTSQQAAKYKEMTASLVGKVEAGVQRDYDIIDLISLISKGVDKGEELKGKAIEKTKETAQAASEGAGYLKDLYDILFSQ